MKLYMTKMCRYHDTPNSTRLYFCTAFSFFFLAGEAPFYNLQFRRSYLALFLDRSAKHETGMRGFGSPLLKRSEKGLILNQLQGDLEIKFILSVLQIEINVAQDTL